jgi:hypothetical protein
MSLDRATPYKGAADRRLLVEGVVAADAPTIETDWLEVKRQADLSETAWQGELGVQILGFANRDPARAGRVVGGYAYIIVGAAPRNVRGVDQVDPSILEDTIGRFVGRGEHAPQWEPFYVMVDERSVLVVVVEPPRRGAPAAPLRATYARGKQTVPEGRLFVRRGGKTTEASANEVDHLFARAKRTARRIEIDVIADPRSFVVPLDLSDSAVERWCERERRRLLGRGRSPSFLSELGNASRLLGAMSSGEYRSEDEYAREIDDYLAMIRSLVPAHARYRAALHGYGAVEVRIVNETDDNFAAVGVGLEMSPVVSGYFGPEDLFVEERLPDAPRAWGERMPSLGFAVSSFMARARPVSLHLGEIERTDQLRVRFGAVNVRPESRHSVERLILFAEPERAGTKLTVDWYATSTSVSGRMEGLLDLPVAEDVMDVASLMALDEDIEAD